MSGHCTAVSTETPSTTAAAGTRLMYRASPKSSNAQMPRVILRTVAPASVLACHCVL